MRRFLGSGVFILIILLLDWYVFQAVRLVTQGISPKWRTIIYFVYWGITAVMVTVFLLGSFIHISDWPKQVRTYVLATLLGLFIAKFIAAIFFLVDDLRRLLYWGGGTVYYKYIADEHFDSGSISRSAFMSWLGIGIGTTLFGTLLFGYGNKYNYQVRKVKLHFPQLPESFRGLKIIQLSDIHAGSLTDIKGVDQGINMVNQLKPDLILFTGDLVNDRAVEMDLLKQSFAHLSAPMGVFSILGNHDYGDYYPWPNLEMKAANLERLKEIQKEMGWRLLLNEHIILEKDGDKLALLGVENWGAKANFKRYGKLAEAYAGCEHIPFKILMSHDPSHWDAEVKNYSDIHLTLSGHTHGMQFGLEIPGFKWSPVQYVYRQWAGKYEEGVQKLYVNRGFGFLGYPGRVGILPEITYIELV
ncbi:MAG: metallophosphoesterase [Sphingobacteriales bacterium]|jgi:predicted MPP superfamily phosphohydrolase